MTFVLLHLIRMILLLTFVSCLVPAIAPEAIAATGGNLLVMGEDSDADSISRHSRIFRRVLDSMTSELHEAGYDVYDEASVTLDDAPPHRLGRDDAELVDIARGARRPPIDTVVVISVYASTLEMGYTTRLRARVSGRLLHVGSGQRLGSFEVTTQKGWRIAPDCAEDRDCLLEEVGDRARVIGRDVAYALREKLYSTAKASPAAADAGAADTRCLPDGFVLAFDGFDPNDILEIEEYLTAFSGYRAHRPTRTALKHHVYWYQSCIAQARLKRNLTRMLEHLGVKGLVRQSGNDFTVQKITARP